MQLENSSILHHAAKECFLRLGHLMANRLQPVLIRKHYSTDSSDTSMKTLNVFFLNLCLLRPHKSNSSLDVGIFILCPKRLEARSNQQLKWQRFVAKSIYFNGIASISKFPHGGERNDFCFELNVSKLSPV